MAVRATKYLMPLVIIALCAYYHVETHREQPPTPAPAAVVAPNPTPPRFYYHSPLDAPALATNTLSGMGYASRNRNTNWRGSHLADGAAARTAMPDDTPGLDAEDSNPPR